MKKIIGNLDIETAEIYAELIKRNVLEDEFGGEFIVAFNASHAIKYPNPLTTDPEKKLLNEYGIGKALKKIKGVFVPEIHAFCNGWNLPFLVQQTLNLTPYDNLNSNQKIKAENQYLKQMELIKAHGIISGDTSIHDNCGVRKFDGNLYLYDFTDWREIK